MRAVLGGRHRHGGGDRARSSVASRKRGEKEASMTDDRDRASLRRARRAPARYRRCSSAPTDARALYVMGARRRGRHAARVHDRGLGRPWPRVASPPSATSFPMWKARRAPIRPPAILWATVRSAIATATSVAPGLPVFAGGKSMGGRMTSQAFADRPLDVLGLAFFGFPLHPTGAPRHRACRSISRASPRPCCSCKAPATISRASICCSR